MDDPTHPVELDTASFEALLIGYPDEDLEGIIEDHWQGKLSDDGKEVLRDEESLREAIFKGGLKNKPFSYFISTVSMGDDGNQGDGAADRRRILLFILLRRICPSLVFCQEPPGLFDKDWGRKKSLVGRMSVDPKRFASIKNGNHAAVVWDTEVFERVDTSGIMTSARDVLKIRDDLKDKGLPVDDFLSRIAMVKLERLTGTGPDDGDAASSGNAEGNERISRFLAVSYHMNRNIATASKRKEKCSALITFLREICDKVAGNIPYVLGGDFNCNSLEEDNFNEENLVIPGYELTSRGEVKQSTSAQYIPHKDNFLYDKNKGFEISNVRPIDLTSDVCFKPMGGNIVKEGKSLSDILDHEPIVGVLEFGKPVKNLEQHFEERRL